MVIDAKKLLIIAIALLILWGSFCFLVVNYAEDLRQDPCSICAKRMGEDIYCSTILGGRIVYEKEGGIKEGE